VALEAALAALAAAGASTAAAGLVRLTGPVDRPRARGSHDQPAATSGGVAIMLGVAVGVIAARALGLLDFAGPRQAQALGLCLAASSLLGLLGAGDDLLDLGPRLKLAAQLSLAGLVVLAARVEALPLHPLPAVAFGPVLGGLGSALWIVVSVNAVNFMDGADGLAAGACALTLVAMSVGLKAAGADALALTALLGAAAAAGFLPWNFRQNRLFQGDAGALFLSFLLASLALLGARRDGIGPLPLYFAPMALTPLLTDVLLTLLARARRGQPLLQAHREHLYQLWLAASPERTHRDLALRMWALTALYALAALLLLKAAPGVEIAGLGVGVGVACLLWRALRQGLEPAPGGGPAPAG
jgi:UDP-GlcNAc:undecaprenyl-phosphate GlcNAc-1-phosphate transferase